jgi:hypothetical protein
MGDMTTEVVSKEERGWLGIMRYNKLNPPKEINKKWECGRLQLTYHWRSSKSLWGRFGGGWQWSLGFEISQTTIMLNLLVFSIRVYWKPQDENYE